MQTCTQARLADCLQCGKNPLDVSLSPVFPYFSLLCFIRLLLSSLVQTGNEALLQRYNIYGDRLPVLRQWVSEVQAGVFMIPDVATQQVLLDLGANRTHLLESIVAMRRGVNRMGPPSVDEAARLEPILAQGDAHMSELRRIINQCFDFRNEVLEGKRSEQKEAMQFLHRSLYASVGIIFGAIILAFLLAWCCGTKNLRAQNKMLASMLHASEESSRLKMNFLNSISHELRTPSE